MPTTRIRIIVLSTLLAVARGACALDAPAFTFSGYGTVGAAHSSNGLADYLIDVSRPSGPGFTRSWSADVDTRLGGQVTAAFGPRLSAVVQVLSQQRADDSYRPTVEWANVKYQATPDVALRAGRVVLPVFMVTESRRVGYANPWVRPPVEVYSLVPVSHSDGVDGSIRFQGGGMINTLQATIGGIDAKFASTTTGATAEAKARRMFVLVDSLDVGFFTARASYGEARLTVDTVNVLFDAYRRFGAAGAAIADRFDLRERRVSFLGLGASYDPGAWFLMAEWAQFDTRSVLGSRSSWYVSGGYRFGRVTPYLTYARTEAQSQRSHPGLPLQALPPALRPTVAGLNAALNAQLGNLPVQRTTSVGLRWDVFRDASVKVQYDRVRAAADSRGTFGRIQPGFVPSNGANVLSVVVDFVF